METKLRELVEGDWGRRRGGGMGEGEGEGDRMNEIV